jgi:hypothetical protein
MVGGDDRLLHQAPEFVWRKPAGHYADPDDLPPRKPRWGLRILGAGLGIAAAVALVILIWS